MGSSMVNSPALLLGIFAFLGIWLNGKTYAAPKKIDCESSIEGCMEAVCSSSCINGKCTGPNICKCSEGWIGNLCEIPVCSSICINGECTGPNKCKCNEGWTGNLCEIPVCRSSCINGKCTGPNICNCSEGWIGILCEIPECSSSCINGNCTGPNICKCSEGWIGNLCEIPVCSSSCINGECTEPNTCKCNEGWTGNLCEIRYTVKPESNISQGIRDVLAEMKKIESMENELLKEIKKKKADKTKNKPALMDSFLKRLIDEKNPFVTSEENIERMENELLKEINKERADRIENKPALMDSFLKRLTGQKQNKTSEFDDYDKANVNDSEESAEDEEEEIYAALWDIDKGARGCLSHHTGRNGTIHFSNVEATGNWRSCFWTIDTNGSDFEITFYNFSMNSCERLIIGDGTSLLPIVIFHGNSLPGSVRLPDAKAYILFISRCHIKAAEFTLHWDSSDAESGCTGLFNNDYGMIHLPANSYINNSAMVYSNVTYRNNESCTWVINSSRPLQIRFTRFSTEKCCDFLYIRDGNTSKSDLLAILRGNSGISSLNTTYNGVHLHFTSDYSNTGQGFTMLWKVFEKQHCGGIYSTESGTIRHPATANNYRNNQNCTWIINSNITLEISFENFNTERCCDHLYIRDGTSSTSPLIGRFSGNIMPTTLRTSTDAYIQFISNANTVRTGFVFHWNISGPSCGAVYNDDTGLIRHPATGVNYQNNENCTWIIKASNPIDIIFERCDTESQYDYLSIRDGETIDSPLLGRYYGSFFWKTVRTTTNTAHVQFTSDSSGTGAGFKLQWNAPVCGGVYNVDNGIINHPATGEYYKNNENCKWIIRASKPFKITFNKFDTESGSDYLYIRDGEFTGSPVLRFSGNDVPSLIQTRTNVVHLSFTSDGSITRTGFALLWNSTGCGGHFTNDSGELTFPENGGTYDSNKRCVWIIETVGPFIEISSLHFSTEKNFDILIIRDGNSSGSPLIGNFSGSFDHKIPFALRTATSKAHISFTSDSSIVGTGFVIRWNTVDAEGNPNCSCGSLNSYQEIVGGEEVEYKVKYPWHVGIFSRRYPNYYFCGGTLISDKYVITAAHCMFPRQSDMMVQIGDHIKNKIMDDIEGITESISVENVYIHPEYIKRTKEYDFALLRLSKSIQLSDGFGIRPICLPHTSHNIPYSNYTGQMGLAVGWGTLSHSSMATPDGLQQVEMTILSPVCRGWARITPAMLCAMESGKDTCQGDSGGSLSVVEKEYSNMTDLSDGFNSDTNEHYVLVGVISWGRGCAARTPGVYSRVTAALDWIHRFAITCNRRGAA